MTDKELRERAEVKSCDHHPCWECGSTPCKDCIYQALRAVYDETLEQAAKVADGQNIGMSAWGVCAEHVAKEIRALKDKP